MRKITVDPITRLEGHGKIEIFLNDEGNVERAYFQVPELRGFEKFCEGRPAEEMPRITPRICGVCPTAHHMASTKCLDDLWSVEPTKAAKKVRELMYSAFMLEDHILHFFFLGGPDFVMGPDAPAAERNILGVIAKVGIEIGKKVIEVRRRCRGIVSLIGGRVTNPVCGLPGGVSKPLSEEDRGMIKEAADYGLEFCTFALGLFEDFVLSNEAYVDLILGDIYKHKTYYMGLVDADNKVNFYDGKIRIVDPEGKEYAKFPVSEYHTHIAEHVEPWTFVKFAYLKNIGWQGFTDGTQSGIYRVAPLARLNAADGMATPLAQEAYEKMYGVLGGKPAHNTLAFHWARLIEALQAAEKMVALSNDAELTNPNVRNIPDAIPNEGFGVVEAPRGTLIHHYRTNSDGIIEAANLIVATQNNAAGICLSIDRAAKKLIKHGQVSDGLLNMVEMAFRAYDPCHACATHALPGKMPLAITLRDGRGNILRTITRG